MNYKFIKNPKFIITVLVITNIMAMSTCNSRTAPDAPVSHSTVKKESKVYYNTGDVVEYRGIPWTIMEFREINEIEYFTLISKRKIDGNSSRAENITEDLMTLIKQGGLK